MWKRSLTSCNISKYMHTCHGGIPLHLYAPPIHTPDLNHSVPRIWYHIFIIVRPIPGVLTKTHVVHKNNMLAHSPITCRSVAHPTFYETSLGSSPLAMFSDLILMSFTVALHANQVKLEPRYPKWTCHAYQYWQTFSRHHCDFETRQTDGLRAIILSTVCPEYGAMSASIEASVLLAAILKGSLIQWCIIMGQLMFLMETSWQLNPVREQHCQTLSRPIADIYNVVSHVYCSCTSIRQGRHVCKWTQSSTTPTARTMDLPYRANAVAHAHAPG